jgi:ketosteroid isomerase-like protein
VRDTATAVSQDHVDKTMAFVDAYNRRDFPAAIKDFHPAVEWVLPELQGGESCCGPEEIIRWWDGLDETFEEVQLLPQETIDAGDQVAVRLRHKVRGKGSGIELNRELYHQVTTFRDGVVVRIEYFEDWAQARRAAGLAD